MHAGVGLVRAALAGTVKKTRKEDPDFQQGTLKVLTLYTTPSKERKNLKSYSLSF